MCASAVPPARASSPTDVESTALTLETLGPFSSEPHQVPLVVSFTLDVIFAFLTCFLLLSIRMLGKAIKP